MRALRVKLRTSMRCGITIWEVLVSLACLLMLAGLIVPALQSTRGSRRSPCISNASNISKAILNFVTRNREELPLLRGNLLIEDDADPATPPLRAPWTMAILPELDQRLLYDRLLALQPADNRAGADRDGYLALSRLFIGGYTCPDSPQHLSPGGLSYVLNAGYIFTEDWDAAARMVDAPRLTSIDWRNDTPTERLDRFSEADQEIAAAAAVGLDPHTSARRQRLSEMYDGASSTLLLAENHDARQWASAALLDIGFGHRVEAADRTPRLIGDGDPDHALQLQPGFALSDDRINSRRTNPGRPRPSSPHPGGVVVSFCDGRAMFLNEAIDERVYAQILTPSGWRYGQQVVTNGQLQ